MSSRALAVLVVTVGTFTDLVAYSIAVPVLPDLTARLGTSPTVVGLLFASFGVTLLGVSVPAGALSDRIGRRLPLVCSMVFLAGSTLLFAYGERLLSLFTARLIQGAADAVAWGVGFALVADLYGPQERGRVMGLVMSGSNLGVMIGPSLGGWLYDLGGRRLPFLVVTGLALVTAGGMAALRLPPPRQHREQVKLWALLGHRPVRTCAFAVIVASATITMLEPVLSLWLASALGLTPGRIGLVFGAAAVASTLLNPLFGRLADRHGGQPLMLMGLVVVALMLPPLGRAWSFASVVSLFIVTAAGISLVVTPSLAYMAEAAAAAGATSFGVSYGLYNFVWGAGLLGGPALGGWLFDRLGLPTLTLLWAPVLVATAFVFWRSPGAVHIGGPETSEADRPI